MTGEHFFVSYSRSDAAEVGGDLADRFLAGKPSHRFWVDVRDIAPGVDWDDQVEDAIQGCRALLLVMTPDSVRRGSGCRDEVAWALKCKKPIIPLRLNPNASLPLRLSSRQYIDFVDSTDQGVARLRIHLGEMDGPKGRLQELRYRLTEAERELPRTVDEGQRARVEQDVQELQRQVVELEGVAADPDKATVTTDERISAGIQAVRRPARPEPVLPARARFVNPPPLTAPTYFQDRHAETGLLASFVTEPDVRLVTVVGRGGVGKTAMVCRLLKGLEVGQLPDELGKQSVDGVVYLRTPGAHPVGFANLFADLCRLLPPKIADQLGRRYKEPHETPAGLMTELLERFPVHQRVVVLLDNFEGLLDEAAVITEDALAEGLRALLSAPAHGVTVLITTRVAPAGLLLHLPGGQRRIDLDEGLPSPYAEHVLRARDPDGRLGLRTATDDALGLLRERTRGYPRALEAVAAILSADRNTSLEELIAHTERLPENVVEALVGEAFNRLDALAQQVLQALAIFPVPVPAVAVDYLLQPHQGAVNAAPVLARLVNMQFVRRDAGRYYLHQVDRDYALGSVPVGRPDDRDAEHDSFTQYALLDRAADYFNQTKTTRAEWKTLDDLAPQLAEFEVRYQGGDYDTAAQVLLSIDDYLLTWGHYRYVIKLHTRLRDHLTDPWAIAASTNSLGYCRLMLGQFDQAIELFGKALAIIQKTSYRQDEALCLTYLGFCYADLGQSQKAIDLHQQALDIDRQAGNRVGETADLGNLGCVYASLGQSQKAIDLTKQALVIAQESGDRPREGLLLNALGSHYAQLGQTSQAIGLIEQALAISRDAGDRYGEATALNELGVCCADLGWWVTAVEHLRNACEIGDEIGVAEMQSEPRLNLAWALLGVGDLPSAEQSAEEAGEHRFPSVRAGSALVTGVVRLLGGELPAAEIAFQDAVRHAQEQLQVNPLSYDALDTKALALAGMTLTGAEDRTSDAITAFHAARAVTSVPGITARVLRKLAALAPADPTGTLHPLEVAARPGT